MKKYLLFAIAAIGTTMTFAQTTDAAKYFTNKPFGWATCAKEDGSVYNLNGGVGYGDPTTITLTASGGDDDSAIKNAISKYDIIILDGSNGDFTIASQMRIVGVKNKTIVGINNARLCTKFWLTPEINAALKAAKLDGLSSTKQISGTLPNGQNVTMDERAFYTKKTMMEATGDNTMSFAQSGIFSFDASDENIIIRNLTFVGPGSVDVDGVDLISQYGASHVWIDHCEFIDGMDGNLDTGKAPGMFVTYSWNIFRYTERSFSHPYSNGCGWLDGYDTPQLFITYANCIWGAGCARRLPQVGATFLHLLNCLYVCPGNSMGCAVNDNSTALIEGNLAVSGVNSPLSFGNNIHAWETRGNNFGTNNQYNTDKKVNGGVSMPYEYSTFSWEDVISVLYGTHGAGATLDNEQVLPEVGASEKPNVDTSGEYSSLKKWDFRSWSEETLANLAADGNVWVADGSNYKYDATTKEHIELSANGTTIAETDGLLFKFGAAGQTILYVSGSGSIRINKSSIYIKIPDCQQNDKLLITCKSANSSQERGMASNQTLPSSFVGIKEDTYEMYVTADGDVELNTPQGGIYVSCIELQRASSTAIETIWNNSETDTNYYNLAGAHIGNGEKGFFIHNGRIKYSQKK